MLKSNCYVLTSDHNFCMYVVIICNLICGLRFYWQEIWIHKLSLIKTPKRWSNHRLVTWTIDKYYVSTSDMRDRNFRNLISISIVHARLDLQNISHWINWLKIDFTKNIWPEKEQGRDRESNRNRPTSWSIRCEVKDNNWSEEVYMFHNT